jgi:hypothetical protein
MAKPNKFDINDVPPIKYPISNFKLRGGRVLVDVTNGGDNVVGSNKFRESLLMKNNVLVDPVVSILNRYDGTATLVAHDTESASTADLHNGDIVTVGSPMEMVPMVFLVGEEKRLYFLCDGYNIIGSFDTSEPSSKADIEEEVRAVKEAAKVSIVRAKD